MICIRDRLDALTRCRWRVSCDGALAAATDDRVDRHRHIYNNRMTENDSHLAINHGERETLSTELQYPRMPTVFQLVLIQTCAIFSNYNILLYRYIILTALCNALFML